MKMVKIKKYLSVLFMLCMITTTVAVHSTPVLKQEPGYSAETLDKFITATRQVSIIQHEGEQKMIDAIERENLDVDTFNQIAEMMINPEEAEQIEVTPEQMDSFTSVLETLQFIQVEIQQEMEVAIINTGMDVEEYQKIVQDYHNDPTFQQQINAMLEN